MGLEVILAGIVTAIVAVIGAFAAGKWKGRTKAESDSAIKYNNAETARVLESNRKATEAQLNAADNAKVINEEVAIMDSGDALAELRRDYARDSDGNKNN